MASLTQIRDAINDALDTIPRLTVATARTQQLPAPYAVVFPPAQWGYHGTFGAGAYVAPLVFRVGVFVGSPLIGQAINDVLELSDPTGTNSVFAAVEADSTLGGVVGSAHVAAGRLVSPEGEIAEWGAEFDVHVVAMRS